MPRRATHLTCTVAECGRPHEARGLCQMHYFRARRETPLGTAAKRTRGPSDETPSYRGAHKRIYAVKGKASEHACTDCSAPAAHWSYTGAAYGREQVSPAGLHYSADPRDYAPRCASCHQTYDRATQGERAMTQVTP